MSRMSNNESHAAVANGIAELMEMSTPAEIDKRAAQLVRFISSNYEDSLAQGTAYRLVRQVRRMLGCPL
jgi:hypothetical protein